MCVYCVVSEMRTGRPAPFKHTPTVVGHWRVCLSHTNLTHTHTHKHRLTHSTLTLYGILQKLTITISHVVATPAPTAAQLNRGESFELNLRVRCTVWPIYCLPSHRQGIVGIHLALAKSLLYWSASHRLSISDRATEHELPGVLVRSITFLPL